MRMTALRALALPALAAAALAASAPQAPVEAADGTAGLYARAVRLDHGEGVTRDIAAALRLYCQAARAGEAEAMFALAWRYLNGRDVPQDDAQGVAWLRRAAAAGHPTAPNLLARLPDVGPAATPRCAPGTETAPARATYGSGPTSPLPLDPPPQIDALASAMAQAHGLERELVLAVIAVESAWRPDVVSHAGAQGLMQLIPDTAARFGVTDPFDPVQNIRGGVRYLAWLLARFNGDVTLALAGYNAGENAVARYDGVPPFDETQNYIRKIRRYYDVRHHPIPVGGIESATGTQVASVN